MPQAPLGTVSYTVKSGDTLYRIAKNYNTTIQNIQAFNQIQDPNKINVGQKLTIPQSPPEAIIYTVKRGDTVYAIAKKYGTSVNNIVRFNYLRNPDVIYPGQQLVVTASLR